jgi:hypothetical protein
MDALINGGLWRQTQRNESKATGIDISELMTKQTDRHAHSMNRESRNRSDGRKSDPYIANREEESKREREREREREGENERERIQRG